MIEQTIENVFASKEFPPTDEQRSMVSTIAHLFCSPRSNRKIAVVTAVAGAGKTETTIDTYKVLREHIGRQYMQVVAFGVSAKGELIERGVEAKHCKTLNGLGHANLSRFARNQGLELELTDGKVSELLRSVDADLAKIAPARRFAKKLIDFAKSECLMSFTRERLERIADHYEIFIDLPMDACDDAYGMSYEELEGRTYEWVCRTLVENNRVPACGVWKIDYNDQVYLPVALNIKCFQNDCLLVDEAQDLSRANKFLIDRCLKKNGLLVLVGDDYQCVSGDTLVKTDRGSVSVKDLEIGDRIECWAGRKVTFNTVKNKCKSMKRIGRAITTQSGKRLNATGEHEIWAALSLEYGIPTYTWKTGNPIIRDPLFERFGQNGKKLLDELEFSFEKPHWVATASNKGEEPRNLIYLNANVREGASVTLEWSNPILTEKLKDEVGWSTGKNNRIRRYFKDYRKALEFATKLSQLTGLDVTDRILLDRRAFRLMPFLQLHVGMAVLVNEGGRVVADTIVEISEHETGEYYDIEVDVCANFFGNDILSHNCIFAWRGCEVNGLENTLNRRGLDTVHLPLTYNWRSGQEIIDFAQGLCPHIKCGNRKSAVVDTVEAKDFDVLEIESGAVLSRLRAPLIGMAIERLRAGLPFTCKMSLQSIVDTVKSIGHDELSIRAFRRRLKRWYDEKMAIYAMNDADAALEELEDTYAILGVILERVTTTDTVSGLVSAIRELDREINESDGSLALMTIHSSKGMQWDTTYVLGFDEIGIGARKEWKQVEARNLKVVACTRAKSKLVFVTGTVDTL